MVEGGFDLAIQKCLICCQQTKQKAGYIGIYCYNCKRIISGEEWAGSIARQRREILQLTKRQIGDKLNLSKHTIHAYEWKKCSTKYLDQLEILIKNST